MLMMMPHSVTAETWNTQGLFAPFDLIKAEEEQPPARVEDYRLVSSVVFDFGNGDTLTGQSTSIAALQDGIVLT
ncbi:hypothetical protein RA20_09065 [Leisingera sp. ANG-Vp]|nr:hypothetical protein RA20_09065 [Leisingera sp. ANG-Vp]